MQVQSSKLHISNTPLSQPEYQQILPTSSLAELEPANKAELHQLQIPVISILYGYHAGQELKGYELQMDVDFMAKGDKIPRKQLRSASTANHLYKLIEIDSCLCYEKPISMVITIKMSQKSQAKQHSNIEELVSQLGNRTYIIYNEKSLVTYRRDFTIKDPISTTHRYVSISPSTAYIWLKCTNQRKEEVRLLAVRLMNWSVKTNEEVRSFESKSSFDQLSKQGMVVKNEEDVGVMLSINGNLGKIEIPCLIEFSVSSYPKQRFKMIKHLRLE